MAQTKLDKELKEICKLYEVSVSPLGKLEAKTYTKSNAMDNTKDRLFANKKVYKFSKYDMYDVLVNKVKQIHDICKTIKTEGRYFKHPFQCWIETGFLEYDTHENKFTNIYFRGKTFPYSDFEDYIKLLSNE